VNWIRCVRCRTVGDRSRNLACPGCGDVYAEHVPAGFPPEVERDAARTVRGSSLLLRGLAILAAIGLVGIAAAPSNDESWQIGAAIGSIPVFILLTALLAWLLGREVDVSAVGGCVSAILFLLSLGGAAIGAAILVAVACSIGGIH
jgi:hypothetical protein